MAHLCFDHKCEMQLLEVGKEAPGKTHYVCPECEKEMRKKLNALFGPPSLEKRFGIPSSPFKFGGF